MMNIQSYLDRLNFNGPLLITKEVLFQLQKSHLLNIPFENLAIHYKRRISLDPDYIYKKIIIEKRGGFCYELNGLFYLLLKEIGFNAKLISARVHLQNNEYSPENDHVAIIVIINSQEYLVDVGFGNFSLEPLKLETGIKINDSFGQFQFDKYSNTIFRINEIKNNKKIPQYIFKTNKCKLSDFKERCIFHQTSRESHFTKKKMISIANENGRITLNNTQLKVTNFGIEKIIKFKESEFEYNLKVYFNIIIKN